MDFFSDTESVKDDKSDYNEADESFSGHNSDYEGRIGTNDRNYLNIDDKIKKIEEKVLDAAEVINEQKEDVEDFSIENFNRNNISSSDYDEKTEGFNSNVPSSRVQSGKDDGDNEVLNLKDHEKTIKEELVGNYNSDLWGKSLNREMHQDNYEVLTEKLSTNKNDEISQYREKLEVDAEENEETEIQAPVDDEEEEEEDEETEKNDNDDIELLLNQPFIKYSKLVKGDKLDLSNMNIFSLDNSLLELTSLTVKHFDVLLTVYMMIFKLLLF